MLHKVTSLKKYIAVCMLLIALYLNDIYIYRLYIDTTQDCYICVHIGNLMRMNRIFVLLIWLALYSSLYSVVLTEIQEERKTFQVTFFKFFKICPTLGHSFILYNCL